MACLKNGIATTDPIVLQTLTPELQALRASRDGVVACSRGVSNLCTVPKDSPSLLGMSEAAFPRASKIRFLLTHRNLKAIDQRIELANGETSNEGTRIALSPPAIPACHSYPHHGKTRRTTAAIFEFKSTVARTTSKCCAPIPVSLINFLNYFFGSGTGLRSAAAFCSSATAELEIS